MLVLNFWLVLVVGHIWLYLGLCAKTSCLSPAWRLVIQFWLSFVKL